MTPDNLNFYTTSLELFKPCLPLLASHCNLSIPQVRHALPIMVKAVIYQSLKVIQTQGQAKFNSEILQARPLALSHNFGINFNQLAQLKPDFTPFRQTLFEEKAGGKNDNVAWLVGLLVQRTGLTIAPLILLFDTVTFFTLKLLADIQMLSVSQTIPAKTFFAWLALQPMLIARLDDQGIITVLGYQSERPLGQYLAQQQIFCTKNSLTAEFSALARLILHYKNTQPLGIMPNEFMAKPKLSPPYAAALENPFIAQHTAANPTTLPTWQSILQRHWMLTAGLLTGMVFGGIALLTPTKEKPKTPITTQQAEAMPHDVAIIRLDSVPMVTKSLTEKTASSVASSKTGSTVTITQSKSQHRPEGKSDTKTTASKDRDKTKKKPKSDTTTNSAKSDSATKSDNHKTPNKSDNKELSDKPENKPKKSDSVKKRTSPKA